MLLVSLLISCSSLIGLYVCMSVLFGFERGRCVGWNGVGI